MRWRIFLGAAVGLFLLARFGAAWEYRGSIESDLRLRTESDPKSFVNIYNRVQIETTADLSDDARALVSLDARYYNFPDAKQVSNLGTRDAINPRDIAVWEAYVDLYGFLVDDLDLRLGKQRIAWGTADTLNQTDNLNPDDFSNPLDFGQKLPTTAFMASYYLGDYVITGVWQPSMHPALLPPPEYNLAAQMALPLPAGLDIVTQEEQVRLPARTPGNSPIALKIAGNLMTVDVSLSYFQGFDDFPLLESVQVSPLDDTGFRSDLEFAFPKVRVFGGDLAGELFSVGFWAEAGLFVPDEAKTVTITMPNAQGTSDTVSQLVLADESYFKYTLGMDYTFPFGLYVNAQYMHGFFTERGRDALGDYLLARVEKKLSADRWTLSLGAGVEIRDWQALSDSMAGIVVPEIAYVPTDDVELAIGAFILKGDEGTLFGAWRDQDQVYLKSRVAF